MQPFCSTVLFQLLKQYNNKNNGNNNNNDKIVCKPLAPNTTTSYLECVTKTVITKHT